MQNSLASLRNFEKTWRSSVLPNGIKVIHAPLKDDQRFYLGVVFKVGSKNETARTSGVSHFLEHMMFRGSERYPSFALLADAFEQSGGEWNGATGYEHTEFSFVGITDTAPQVIQLFAEFLQTPKLLDLERERQIILREIDDHTNDFGHCTDLDQHLKELFWPRHGVARAILGTVASVKGLTLSDLQTHRNTYYFPGNMAICVVGGEDNGEMLELVGRSFANYSLPASALTTERGPLPRDFAGPRCKWVEHSDNQYHVSLSFGCEGEWSQKLLHYNLLNTILSDGFSARLPFRLREELGLVYDIRATANLFSNGGTIDLATSIGTENLGLAVREVAGVIKRFRGEGPTQKELDKAKQRVIVDLSLFPSDHEGLGFRLAWHALCGRDPLLSTMVENVTHISTKDIHEIANELFTANACGAVALGPRGKDVEGVVVGALGDL